MDDGMLLRQYVQDHSQDAFAELVRRHLAMVYAAALREVRDPHLAEDVSQAVFMVLARRAERLTKEGSLAGWLFRTACYAASSARARERRRKHHEQRAGEARPAMEAAQVEENWAEIEPRVNAALARLGSKDREAIVLRYLEDLKISEVAEAMRVSEAAAKMRIGRALEKLRGFLGGQPAALSVSALGAVLQAKSIAAVPAGLAGAVTSAVVTGAVGATGNALLIAKGAMNMMAWARIKLASGVAVMTLAAIALSVAVGEVATSGRPAAGANADPPAATAPATLPAEPAGTVPMASPPLPTRTAQSGGYFMQGRLYGNRAAAQKVREAWSLDPDQTAGATLADRDRVAELYDEAIKLQPGAAINAELAHYVAGRYAFVVDPVRGIGTDYAKARAWWKRALGLTDPSHHLYHAILMGLGHSTEDGGLDDRVRNAKVTLDVDVKTLAWPAWDVPNSLALKVREGEIEQLPPYGSAREYEEGMARIRTQAENLKLRVAEQLVRACIHNLDQVGGGPRAEMLPLRTAESAAVLRDLATTYQGTKLGDRFEAGINELAAAVEGMVRASSKPRRSR